MRKVWFLHFSRSVLVTYVITVSLEKLIIVLEKVLNLGSEFLYEPCCHLTLFLRKMCKM